MLCRSGHNAPTCLYAIFLDELLVLSVPALS